MPCWPSWWSVTSKPSETGATVTGFYRTSFFLPREQTFEFLLYSLIRFADPGFVNALACVKMCALSRYQDESGDEFANDKVRAPMDGSDRACCLFHVTHWNPT